MLFCASVCWAQNFDYLTNARQRLSEGECEKAENNYKVYQNMTNGKRDLELERAIAECKQGKKPSATTKGSTSTQSTNSSSTPAATNSDQVFEVGGVKFTMVKVQGGTFTMGATSEQGSDADSDEMPAHSVTLSTYYIGQTEVTQALWRAVTGDEPTTDIGGWTDERGRGNNYPAYLISYDEAEAFCRELSRRTGRTFRLPTEAEWEYAARGGSRSQGCKYAGSDFPKTVAWFEDNSGSKNHPVAQKNANELGLYDMSGNVFEWCKDWRGVYSSGSQTNPTGPNSGSYLVIRGGSWDSSARSIRVSDRGYGSPFDLYHNGGFRLVLQP